jgi:hypothetical protein
MTGDLDTAQASTSSRKAFLDEHAPVQHRLDQIDDILSDRVDRAVRRAINDQPSYLTRTLGPLPTNGEPVGTWIDAATVIETYRLEHGIVDKHRAFGKEPRDPADRAARREAAREVEAITTPAQPEPSEPDLGVDMEL